MKGVQDMFNLTLDEMTQLEKRLEQLPIENPTLLEGFACSASDTSCTCGWCCTSEST